MLISLNEYISQFDSIETKRAYTRDINLFFAHVKKDPIEVTKLDIISYLNELKKQKKSSASIWRMLSSVRSYLKFLYSMESIVKSPDQIFGSLNLPTLRRKDESGLNDSETRKIVLALKNNIQKSGFADRLIIFLMLYNGLRRGEVCGLNVGDVAKNSDGHWMLRILGKGSKIRTIPIHGEVAKAIANYSVVTKHKSNDEPLIMSKNRKRLNGQDIYNVVKRYQKLAKIGRKIHPHMFRAKFVSMALESGVPITSVQADVGHSSIETTAMYDRSKTNYDRSSILKIRTIA